ncbi:alpha/beta hydrolase family protein [Streptomyces sulphureus]|uniref:alpha/beta hydrolase family protein n=1 Tax=Streptomyces sulphureus TaxID=47758 RepID=UPI001FE057FD|nr:alpha/beta hydrolase [Streptomyces sulphureus]
MAPGAVRAPVPRWAALPLAALLLTGCTSQDGEEPGRSTAPGHTAREYGCFNPDEVPHTTLTVPLADGQETGGLLVGDARVGATGVLLSHQDGGTVCEWREQALKLAEDGYLVLAVEAVEDRLEEDVSGPDVAAVEAGVGTLRQKGARTVFLMGASRGAAASLQAAPDLDPPAAGVVAISSPDSYRGLEPLDAVKKLRTPVLYLVSPDDLGFDEQTERLYRASTAAEERDLVVKGLGHGAPLLESGEGMWGRVVRFLERHGEG